MKPTPDMAMKVIRTVVAAVVGDKVAVVEFKVEDIRAVL